MKFLKQIKIEIKNILRSKFLLIIGLVVVFLGGIAWLVINAIAGNININNPGYGPIYEIARYGTVAIDEKISPIYPSELETITVNGVTITSENPFFWNIRGLVDEKTNIDAQSSNFSSPEAVDLLLELMDYQIAHYLRLAQVITTQEDYRIDLAWPTEQFVLDKFVYEKYEVDIAVLKDAMRYRMDTEGSFFKEKYIDITAEERLKALGEVEDNLNEVYKTIENNDFPAYVAIFIEQENVRIADMEKQIALHEQTIIENPDQEEYLNTMIEDLKRQINLVKTNNIPNWEYRLEKNIIPRDGSWQNDALYDIENNRNQLAYTIIVSEEVFNKELYLIDEYGTYTKYKAVIQAQIDSFNEAILIAQHSLDAEKPDMKYVLNGARSKTVGFLVYSIFVALFSVLLGGWLIAREFSQGTIRLLMIRPKTRTKILLSKFLAALVICLVIYVAGSLLNLVANGILFGFADYGYPNFTASGEIGFFAFYIPKFLLCIITILVGFTFAFMMSTVTRNIAVSIIVPVVLYIGSYIGMNMLAYSSAANWLVYTPIPYMQISSFFEAYSSVSIWIDRGIPINLTYGIIMLTCLSVLFTIISIWVFKKRDITN